MEQNRTKVTQYLLFRLLLLYSVLLSCVFLRFNRVFSPQVAYAVLSLTSFSFLMTTAFILMRKNTEDVSYFVGSQVVYDILFTTALTYYTGTNESIYVTYYLINIMFTAVLLSGVAAIVAALASGGLYFVLAYFSSENFAGERSYLVMTTETSFLVVALLTGQLVDEIKKNRARIGRLEKLSDEIIESLDAGLLGFNEKGIIIRVNKTARVLLNLGHSPLGRSIAEVFPAINPLESYLKSQGGSVPASIYDMKVAGTDRRFLISMVSISDKSFIVLFRDLTDLLDLEEKVRANEHLASVGSLAASLAHEIRNPVASISGAAQLLSQKDTEEKERERLITLIVRETERVDLLIRQLLQFAKTEPINRSAKTNLLEVLEACIESIKARSEFKQCPVLITLQQFANEKPSTEKTEIHVNSTHEVLTEIFSNLILNAYQALMDTDHKESNPRIVVEVKSVANNVEVVVKDNGPGIRDELKKKIFEPFFTTKTYGTGLGLARVHKIVKDYGGHIEMVSPVEQNKGTLFKVSLPNAA